MASLSHGTALPRMESAVGPGPVSVLDPDCDCGSDNPLLPHPIHHQHPARSSGRGCGNHRQGFMMAAKTVLREKRNPKVVTDDKRCHGRCTTNGRCTGWSPISATVNKATQLRRNSIKLK